MLPTLRTQSKAAGAVFVILVATCLSGAESKSATTNAPPPKWSSTVGVGLTLTRGNSQTFLATFTVDSKRKWDHDEVLLGLAAGYGTDKNVENTEYVSGFAQYNHLFSDRFYGGIRLDGNYDGIAQLDYRIRVSPLAGYYLLKETNTTLAVEAGPSAVFEQHHGQSEETYLGLRLGERFTQKLSAKAKLWESLDYVPRVDDWAEKYVVTFETGVDAAVNKHWSLRIVFQDIYDSRPTQGKDNNDLRLVVGTAYKF
jgi:putative salt-induced outer membrane protein YdiY